MQVIEKRAQQQLQICKGRKHIVEGFLVAVDDLETAVKTIRAASDGKAARDSLRQLLTISEEQADAVLNMSLRRLTGLAVGELRKEEKELKQQIDDLTSLLENPVRSSSLRHVLAGLAFEYFQARNMHEFTCVREEYPNMTLLVRDVRGPGESCFPC